MRIYIGRWDLLPTEWEGYNGLIEKSEDEIAKECDRQIDAYYANNHEEDNFIACYTDKEFEEEFNGTTDKHINSHNYWIRIFN